MFRILILVILAVLMLTVMFLTWGSIGSAVMAFGLLTMGAALLYQKFLTNRDPDQFQEE